MSVNYYYCDNVSKLIKFICLLADIVRRLLECGADVSRITNTADTMLHGAVFGNKPEITEMLIKAGCDVNEVNSKNQLPLYTAVDHRAENELATRVSWTYFHVTVYGVILFLYHNQITNKVFCTVWYIYLLNIELNCVPNEVIPLFILCIFISDQPIHVILPNCASIASNSRAVVGRVCSFLCTLTMVSLR